MKYRPVQYNSLEENIRSRVASGLQIAVIIPCYNVSKQLEAVVQGIPDYVQQVVLVDDSSRDGTGALIDKLVGGRVYPVHLPCNLGVGGATLRGFQEAAKRGADILVKMDGDGQMDPQYLPLLLEPLLSNRADYTKGNRFHYGSVLARMPWMRLVGNAILSFFNKLASGYWNIVDPSNGYIAIHSTVFRMLPAESLHHRFFFESSMLIHLGLLGATVVDVPIPALYGEEDSNLSIMWVVFEFPFLLIAGFIRRFWLRKVLYSLTMEAVCLVSGLSLIFAGASFGVYEFIVNSVIRQLPATSGTVMLSALPIILGFQMIMNAILLDIQSVPNCPISGDFKITESKQADTGGNMQGRLSGDAASASILPDSR